MLEPGHIVDALLNPYKPGSEEWHRHNLGIKPGVIGQVEKIEWTTGGSMYVKGWFWGPVPPTMAGWSIDYNTDSAYLLQLIDKEETSMFRRLLLWWSDRHVRRAKWAEAHKDDWDQHDYWR